MLPSGANYQQGPGGNKRTLKIVQKLQPCENTLGK
jgi:hypothetical protein